SFFFQAEDGIRDFHVTGVQTCALPISGGGGGGNRGRSRRGGENARHPHPPRDVRRQPPGCLSAGHPAGEPAQARGIVGTVQRLRSEERRVGKECRYQWSTS